MKVKRLMTLILAAGLALGTFTACKGKKPKDPATYMPNGGSSTENIYAVPGVDTGTGLTGSMLDTPMGAIPEPGAESRLPDELGQGYFEEALPIIYFDFDRFDLSASEMDKVDRLVVPYVLANPSAHIQIEGHCDERGTEEYNLNLGQKRASAVRDYLISRGCNETNLHTISYGEERPVDPGQSETAYAKNRRVQFLVYFTE